MLLHLLFTTFRFLVVTLQVCVTYRQRYLLQTHNQTWLNPNDKCIRHYCKDGMVSAVNQRLLCYCDDVSILRH